MGTNGKHIENVGFALVAMRHFKETDVLRWHLWKTNLRHMETQGEHLFSVTFFENAKKTQVLRWNRLNT